MKDNKKKGINWNLILMVIVAIVCGGLSGAIALFLTTSGSIPFLSNYNVDSYSNKQIVIDQPRNVVIEQDLQVKQLENNLLPTLSNVYLSKDKTKEGYAVSSLTGQALVLTVDGWVLGPAKLASVQPGELEVVGYQNKEYKPSKYVQDKVTGLVFAKTEARNLPVAAIGKSRDLALGQTVALVSGRKNLEIAHIRKIGYDFASQDKLVQSSEAFGKELFLDVDVSSGYEGAIVSTLKGEVVGVVTGGRIVMADYFSRVIKDILAGKQIIRPQLGMDYLDLANTEGVAGFGEKGAYITSVDKNFPAYGQIKAGDVIRKVNDFELNAYMSLSEAINYYNSGNKVELLFTRDGKDQSVTVVLK